MHKVLFWSGFGLAVRFWQLGLEMRPFFNRGSLWAYPVFAAIGGSFGYWLQGVSERQNALLDEKKYQLLEKRRRRDERIKAQEGEEQRLHEDGATGQTGREKEKDRGFIMGRN